MPVVDDEHASRAEPWVQALQGIPHSVIGVGVDSHHGQGRNKRGGCGDRRGLLQLMVVKLGLLMRWLWRKHGWERNVEEPLEKHDAVVVKAVAPKVCVHLETLKK
jgi:hypothetical protein